MSAPLLTVAVLAGPLRERAQRVVDEVAAQDVAGDLEVMVVDLEPARRRIAIPDGLRGITVDLPGGPLSRGKGEAVRRASAPAVAFLEDHCYPRPGWARALIEAHRGPWAAVGYAFENANPDTWVSRSAMLSDYIVFVDPPRGPAGHVSGNNVSYRRDALLAFGDRLDDLLIVDYNLHQALRRRGERLFIESRALVAHENYSRVADLARANRAYCRVMAANRARGWSPARRLFYALVAPVAAPAIKLGRLVQSVIGRPRLAGPALAAAPVILTTYAWAAAGESRGYFDASASRAEEDFLRWELATPRA
ncbi:MAG: glycosyltransferase [Actinomycetota bacterium]|nr:glycosyltransferase [Actinomycetota bacterium]